MTKFKTLGVLCCTMILFPTSGYGMQRQRLRVIFEDENGREIPRENPEEQNAAERLTTQEVNWAKFQGLKQAETQKAYDAAMGKHTFTFKGKDDLDTFRKNASAAAGQIVITELYKLGKEYFRDKSEENFDKATTKILNLRESAKSEYEATRKYYIEFIKQVKNPHKIIIPKRTAAGVVEVGLFEHLQMAESMGDKPLIEYLRGLYNAPAKGKRAENFETILKKYQEEVANGQYQNDERQDQG